MSLEITLPATSLELFHEGEFGGRIFRTEEITDRRSYLIKCDRYEQSVNEYVAQCFIRAIGLPAPDARLIRISSEILQVNNIDAPVNVFGGVEYLGGIKRVFDRDIFESGDDRAKRQYCQLLILNRLLGDHDATVEIYEKDGGELLLLDLGETISSEYLLAQTLARNPAAIAAFQAKCKNAVWIKEAEERMRSGRESCAYRMEKNGGADDIMIAGAVSDVLDRVTTLNLRNMGECFWALKAAYGEWLAKGYRSFFEPLRSSCRLLKKYA